MTGTMLDVVVAGFLGFAVWRGWKRGLIRGVAKIVGLIVAAVAAALLHGPVAVVLRGVGVPAAYDDLAAAGAVFLGVMIGFRFAGNLMAKALRATKIGGLADAGIGALLSGIWALSVSTLVLLGVHLFDGSTAAKAIDSSTLASSIVEGAPDIAQAALDADIRTWLMRILRPDSS